MPSLRRFLSHRRLLAFLGVAALLFGLAMLHPYPRQSLFGPKIRGKPWCVWEAEVRRMGDRPPSFADTIMSWLGIERQRLSWSEVFDDPEMIPIVVEMLEDGDYETRHTAMTAITSHSNLQDQTALPSLRGLLGSKDIMERAMAAWSIWRINHDQQVISVILELLEQKSPVLRGAGIAMIAEELSASGEPEFYPHIRARASDPNPDVRASVMAAMKHSGKKGVPVLIAGLDDSNKDVRTSAAWALRHIGADAAEAIPALERRLNDGDNKVQNEVVNALRAIDPQRFEHLNKDQKIK